MATSRASAYVDSRQVDRTALRWSKAVVLGVEDDRLVSRNGVRGRESAVPRFRQDVSENRDVVPGFRKCVSFDKKRVPLEKKRVRGLRDSVS